MIIQLKSSFRLLFAAVAFGIGFNHAGAASGTWTSLAHTAPGSINTMLLLTDGTVMGADGGRNWYRLTPDNAGSYINGTWSTLSPMVDSRLYYASQVLTNGKVFIAGAEYGTGKCSAELYDPLLNSWSFCPGAGQIFSDNISKKLPNGNVLVSPVYPSTYGGTIIYNVTANSWTAGPTLYRGFYQDEASWVRLPDNSILTVDPFGTNSERYIPSLNTWINDANVPVTLYDAQGELGASFLMPNGKAIFFGGTIHTAIYTPSGNTTAGTWTAGPDGPAGFGSPDSPAAMLVTGNILCSMTYPGTFGPTNGFYEYDTVANTFSAVAGPPLNTNTLASYYTRMLDLPDGNVLFSVSGSQLYVYHPSGSPLAAGQPAILTLTTNFYNSYHITGTLLNGISEGAAYGDDAQMDSNYPIVRLTNNAGTVYYARTFNISSTSVMTSNQVLSADFSVPTNLPSGIYSLMVVANGNSSAPVSFDFERDPLLLGATTGFVAVGPTNGPFNSSSKSYTLTNSGAGTLNWAASTTAGWLTLSATNGSLIPGGGSSTVTVSVNSTANSMAVGAYNATVYFTNQVTGAFQSVPFRLQVNPLVINGNFESGSLAYWTLSGTPGDTQEGSNGQYSGQAAYVHAGFFAAILSRTNQMGYLTQNIITSPQQKYILSFWLNNPTASASNQFQVSWNGSIVYNFTNRSQFSYTNIHFLVSATAASTALQFGFRNNTNYFGLDDVTLLPVNTPVFQYATQNVNTLYFSWNATPGVKYQVQYATDLLLSNWANFGGTITAVSTAPTSSDTIVAGSQRFYRVLMLP